MGLVAKAAPDLPTVAEAGLPGYAVSEWYGVVAPAGTGAAHIGRINGELRKVLAQPDVKERLVTLGAEVVASSPQEFGAFIKAEIAKWGNDGIFSVQCMSFFSRAAVVAAVSPASLAAGASAAD